MDKIISRNIGLIIFIIVLIIIGTIIGFRWPTIEVNPELSSNVYDILLKYLIIIFVAERSIAVYISVQFEGKWLELKRRIKYHSNPATQRIG